MYICVIHQITFRDIKNSKVFEQKGDPLLSMVNNWSKINKLSKFCPELLQLQNLTFVWYFRHECHTNVTGMSQMSIQNKEKRWRRKKDVNEKDVSF